MVVEKDCRRVTIRDLTAYENEFDGLAAYKTEDSIFSGLQLYDNCCAGLSFDLDFNNNTVSDANIFRTPGISHNCPTLSGESGGPLGTVGKVGIFMRDSMGNTFLGVRVRNTREHGVFIAEAPTGAATGNTFVGLVVLDIADASMNGFRVNDASCVDNLLDAAQFINNAGLDIVEAAPLVKGQIIGKSETSPTN